MDLRRKQKKEIPCASCPYQLGLLDAVRNPCPECRSDGYSAYVQFIKICGIKPERERMES